MGDHEPEIAAGRMREEVRARPGMREKWLECTRLGDSPILTTLTLVGEVNRLEDQVEILTHELDRALSRLDALDGGDPMSRQTW